MLLAARRAAFTSVLSLALAVGCAGRWQPNNPHEVATQAEPPSAFATVLEVAAAKSYRVVDKDAATKKLRLESHTNSKSFIDIDVVAGKIKLTPAGSLVRGGKVHKALGQELNQLEEAFEARFGGGPLPAGSASAVAQTPVPAEDTPVAWSEPAYDPSVWGNGNFTCLPVRVPAEHQSALSLRLSNGEKADLQLSLAYDQGLCRSPTACKQTGGCPALGIGDAERVSRLAGRLSRGEVGPRATLLDSGKSIATIDLTRHGSIVQALSEIKH